MESVEERGDGPPRLHRRVLRVQSDEILTLPAPVVDATAPNIVFVEEHVVKVTVSPDGDVTGATVQFALDDAYPRCAVRPLVCMLAAPLFHVCHLSVRARGCLLLRRYLSGGRVHQSTLSPTAGSRTGYVRIRQSCRFTARMHADGYIDSPRVQFRFTGGFSLSRST